MTVSLEDQIKCVRRELAMRGRVYAQWVAGGRMKQEAADKELAAMQAVHDTLTAIAGTAADGILNETILRSAVTLELAEVILAARPAQGAML